MAHEEAHQPSVYTGVGIDVVEFNAALDRYLMEGTGELDVFVRMNKRQQFVFQEVKKSFNRINKRINLYGERGDQRE